MLPFTDANLEKLYVFAKLLSRYIPKDPRTLPEEIKSQVDMESYRVHLASAGTISLDRPGVVDPATPERAKAAKSGDDKDFAKAFLDILFARFVKQSREGG